MSNKSLFFTEKTIGRHTKRLQKELAIINHDLKLSDAQNMLSRILGMKDFHELKQVLKFDINTENEQSNPNIKTLNINNPFQIFRNFDLNFFDEILNFVVENEFSSLTIDENNGINLFFENNIIVKINTEINKKILNELVETLYGNIEIISKLNGGGNSYDFMYTHKSPNNQKRFRVNISPVWYESKNSFFITIMTTQYKIFNWDLFNSNIKPLNYSHGLNLILSNDIEVNSKIQASMIKEILNFASPMNIVSLECEDKYDYSLINKKHIFSKSMLGFQFNDLSDAIKSASRRKSNLILINEININSLETAISAVNSGSSIFTTLNFTSNIKEFLNKILNLNKYTYSNLIESLNNILIPINIKDDNENNLFIFELTFSKEDKIKLINNNPNELLENLKTFTNKQLIPQIEFLTSNISQGKLIKNQLYNKLGLISN